MVAKLLEINMCYEQHVWRDHSLLINISLLWIL